MEKEFIPYEQALVLKELGFDEPCFGCYDEKGVFGLTVMSIKQYYINIKEDTWNCSAPLKQQVFRWFRDKHKLVFYVNMISIALFYYVIEIFPSDTYKTYEEAEDALIDKLIEIVKQNNKK